MSNAAIMAAAETAGEALPAEKPRHWVADLFAKAFSQSGARIGLAWAIVFACGACYAPLLASSYPLLLRTGGRWSSPWARSLSAADVTLLLLPVLGLALLLLRRLPARTRLMTLGIGGGCILVVAALVCHPPRVHVYEEYRELEAAGRVQYVLRAPLPYSPSDRLRDQFVLSRPHPWPPSRQHLMGTDRSGADVLSGMLHACRLAMSIGFVSTGIAMVIGVIIGGLMGYFAGWIDLIGMRLVEIFSAIPGTYLLIACIAFLRGWVQTEAGLLYLMMVVIGLLGWVGYARFARAEFLRLRKQDFVAAAIAGGLPLPTVLFRHILPNAVAPLLVSASFGVAGGVFAEAMISFLGLGFADEPSWGKFLNQALSAGGGFYWWLASFPGSAIFITVFSYNLIGEALRDAFDPLIRKAVG